MKSMWLHVLAVFTLLCSIDANAAPYPSEIQLQTAIRDVVGLLKTEGLALEIFDAQKEGVTRPLMAAGLNLDTGVCIVFYNTKPENGLIQFFGGMTDKEMPVWLDAIAAHEATHCVEQREAYIRERFSKVLPPGCECHGMTLQGYISVVESGTTETWTEALADIASILYLKQAEPVRWRHFATGIADMRHDLAAQWPEHDTSPWLRKLIASNAVTAKGENIFDAAFRLRLQLQPN